MPAGKLRKRAGIESLSYAAEDENELTLGATAKRQAPARCDAKEVDWIIATSETHGEYPSLTAQLHNLWKFVRTARPSTSEGPASVL